MGALLRCAAIWLALAFAFAAALVPVTARAQQKITFANARTVTVTVTVGKSQDIHTDQAWSTSWSAIRTSPTSIR